MLLRTWLAGLLAAAGMIAAAAAQTAPAPQPLPYLQNFGAAAFNALPAGVAAWNGLNGGSISSQTLAANSSPTGDATLTTATTPQTGGGCYGYASGGDACLYIQTSSNSTNGANQAAIAVNTTGSGNIQLAYDIDILSAQPRTIGVICQYRVGTSGTWTSLTPAVGNPFSQAGGSVGPKASVSILLPAAADNQPIVQIRWAVWRGNEGGNSSGLAIDNIAVTAGGDPWSPPPSHYAAADGLSGAALKSALRTISASGQVTIGYENTFVPLRVIHQDPANSNNVVTVFSGTSLGKNEVYFSSGQGLDPNATWNREHLWPVSFGLDTGSNDGPDYSDLFNLRPAIYSVNTLRGNLYFDESDGSAGVPQFAPQCSYDSNSWEPRASEKGDIARTMFYMATRYDGSDPSTIDLELSDTPSTAAGRFAKLSTLLLWHELDPVTEEERRIHQLIVNQQGNRNPFVDRPEYVARIWGSILLGKTAATAAEGGAGDSYTLTLTGQPTANVTVQVSATPSGQVTLSPASVTFTPGDWDQPRTITISAVDDTVYETTASVTLSHGIASADAYYGALSLAPVTVTVTDNDPLVAAALLPLAYGGPWSPLPSVGFFAEGLGDPYTGSLGGDTGSGSAKFDNTGDRLTIAFVSTPALLGYHLKANTGGASTPSEGVFQVLESADGENFTLIRTVANKDTGDQAYSDPLAPDSRYVRFFYQQKTSGNIQLDKLAINAAAALTPWQAWQAFYELSGPEADADYDADFDGVPNLAEYALGRSPVAADPPASAPGIEKIPGKLRISAVVRITDSTLATSVQSTVDLSNPASWTETGVVRSVAADQSEVPSGFERTMFEIDDNDAPQVFARLRFSIR